MVICGELATLSLRQLVPKRDVGPENDNINDVSRRIWGNLGTMQRSGRVPSSANEAPVEGDQPLTGCRNNLLVRKYEYFLLLLVFALFLVTRLLNLKIVPISGMRGSE
jgi:hypothetical protein